MMATQSRAFVVVRLLGVAMLWLGLAGRAEEPVPSLAPLNPEFVAYQTRLAELARSGSRVGGDGRFGHRPAPVDLSHLAAQVRTERAGTLRSLPAKFDWRTAEPGKLSPVRNQNPYNTCWTFAAYASLESWLRPAETPDYSERHMAHTHGYDLGYDDGGNHFMSSAYLARWSGPVDEADCPYSGMPTAPSGSYTARKQVREVLFYPSPVSNSAAMDLLKEAIMAHGALYVAYHHDDSFYKSANRAYYCANDLATNHAVSVVGWDDDFTATKFVTEPGNNGAWILRNSWGTGWGDGGYFYLSYHDKSFQKCTPALFTAAAEAENYDHVHQHDPLGLVSSFGYQTPQTVWGANVFALNGNEILKAVAFYTASRNVPYEVRVYRNLASTSPSSGTLCGIGSDGATVVSGTFAESGYHTVVLPTAVLLEAPQNFSVVVTLADTATQHPMAMEYAIPNYSSAASSSPGQSFYSSNGSSWTDLTVHYPSANFCIKAFTDEPPPEIDVLGGSPLQSIPSGNAASTTEDGTWFGSVGIGGSLAHTFTIRNTGAGTLYLTGSPLVAISGGEAGDFAVTAQPDSVVAAGGSTTFAMTFSPAIADVRSATVSIASNDPDESSYTFAVQGGGLALPVAVDDSYGTVRNTPLVVAAPGVLANDDDAEGGTMTASLLGEPANGTVVLAADGGFTYTPGLDFVGTDTFTYRASVGERHSAAATVTIAVAKSPQTIEFAPLGTKHYGDAPFELAATATSGLPVVFASSDPAVATVEGSTVTIIGLGTATITANQAGNALWSPAPEASQPLTVVFADPLWSVRLDVSSAVPAALAFGMHEFGSDGWDEGLDLLSGEEDQVYLASADLAVCLRADYRGSAAAGEFLLVVEAAGEPITLAWETPLLPEGKYLALYEVSLAGRAPVARELVGNTALDMAATRTLAVPAGGTRYYVIRYGDELVFDLAFRKGWNLVSLPIAPLLPSVADVLASGGDPAMIHEGSVLAWNGTAYVEVTEMAAGIGYWVCATGPAVRLIEGLPVVQDELVLAEGLNLLGPARPRALPVGGLLPGPVWMWNPQTLRYSPADALWPGQGYWFRATAAGNVPLEDR